MSGQVPARQSAPVVPVLGRWGLSPHADLIYRTLTMRGPQTCAMLARELDIDGGRLAAATDELSAAGAARLTCRGRERWWHAVDVHRVGQLMRQRRGPVAVTEGYRRHLAAVAGLHLERVDPATVRRLPTREAARERIAALTAAERREHLAINTEEQISAEAAAVAGPQDRGLVARGVRLRALSLPPRAGGPRDPVPAGAEYRETTDLPLKLMIFDRHTALFPADPARFDAGAVQITDADAVAHLTQLFHRIWRTARDPFRQEVPPIELTAREQAILTLLTDGYSEEAAGEALGLSRRTVVYTLRALMDRLGVQNRFQLALVLGAARAVPLPGVPVIDTPTPEEI
ncbi:LuxR C-terminal-related transcriptional regulator [Actinoplanes xinjiangensis]|uniref:LuxR C-terminal-related transcriptional regulator n=1 Tax=Actinoplanes xinjiangensis TaxID=512350 RepID=UPI0034147CCA